jgi:hypothetical protein
MDAKHFDDVARQFAHATVHRRLLAGLAMSPFAGFLAARQAVDVVAKKKRRKKRKTKKPQPNEYGCLDVGKPCNGDGDMCCSGICEGTKPKKGKKDTSRCVAHDTGGCQAGVRQQSCSATPVPDIRCTTSTGNPEGYCNTTTGNAAYCVFDADCFPCRKDADCQAFCGPRAACIRCDSCPETGGTSCAHPHTGGCDLM